MLLLVKLVVVMLATTTTTSSIVLQSARLALSASRRFLYLLELFNKLQQKRGKFIG